MTSRPPLAVQQRQPQRSISGSGLSQRPPPHQRTLSQQYLPPSPVRKSESFNDQSSEVATYGTTPRRGGSRLKLELANDGITHAGFSESPLNLDPLSANKAFTPSRMMHPSEASPLGDMTALPSRSQTADNDSIPLPMPPRRARFVVPVSNMDRPAPAAPAPVKKDVKPKPFVLETPGAAPRYSNMGKGESPGYADFNPWAGNGPEDRFSDQGIRHGGNYDKPPAQLQTEQGSAKATLFPALKHKSGLHTLSTLFTGIMNQRRHSGQITSASTFKPPPRVTLTDTKRELWLKDLSNPAISLRRLSRTIPHGIRGRVLLDQCLSKNVPTDRAVWLAKCVGANEIRAFKRKGVNGQFVMGGDTKWIRDWTVHIEQFVESIVGAFTEPDWKAKVTYAIRLATHLYSESLLERDHFMDWLVSGLENSNQARLPMWLLIIRIFWQDLLRYRKVGRRFVTAVLSHHAAIYTHPDRDVLLPLSTQLQSLLEVLLIASPDSFIHPPTWTRYRGAVLPLLETGRDAHQRIAESIDHRVERLISTNIKSRPAVRGIVVKILDTTLRKPYTPDLAAHLWKTSEDKSSLVMTMLEWCISLHRPGVAKVYVTTSILRLWSSSNVDITGIILEFLSREPVEDSNRKHLVYHLISELVRSDHFSVPQYLQWLIARGGLVDLSETQPDGPCITRLLVEIPLHTLKDSIRSLRATILRKGGFSADFEADDIANAIKCIQQSFGLASGANDAGLPKKPLSIRKIAKRLALSSRALQAEIGNWLYNGFVSSFTRYAQLGKGSVELSSLQFDSVRQLLEATQDFTMLDRTIRSLLLVSSNADLLAACADTVSLHCQVFAAAGTARPMFDTLLERLKAVNEVQGIGARPLLASLAWLAPRLPGLESVATHLQNDLLKMDRSNAVDASSPLSDNMATQLQDDETELNEQIEKLATFTHADRPTIERLFHAIINRLQGCWNKADERQRPYCVLLTRLRVFDTQHFDNLMKGWVQHIRKLTHRPPMPQIFPLLISFSCLSMATLFATAGRNGMQSGSAIGFASIYVQEILQLLVTTLTPNRFMSAEDCYRFRIVQDQTKTERAKELMVLIRGALAEYAASRGLQPPIPQPLDDEKTRVHFLELLRSLVLVDPQAASQTLSLKSPDGKLSSLIENITTKLLLPEGGGQKSFEQVLELANEFTLPFCQVKLSLNMATEDSGSDGGGDRLQSQLVFLSKALDNAIDANNLMWTGMLPSMSPEITQHMKARAEARLLEMMPTLKNPLTSEDHNNKNVSMAENLLAVIDMIIRGTPGPKSNQISYAVIDKITDLWEILSSTNPDAAALKKSTIEHWLPVVLSYMSLLSSGTADTSKPANETRARALLALAGLVQELDHLRAPDLSQRAYDLALLLADNLVDDARLQCVRAVKDSTSDPRIRYLFSFSPNPAENLMLAHKEKPPPGMGINERRAMAYGIGMGMLPERLTPFVMRRWEILSEPTPNVGENDTSLSLHLFDARKIQ